MTRPRILRIITRLNVGGPATHVVLADRGLRARGWDTLLVYGTVEPDEAEIDIAAVDIDAVRVASLGRPIRPAADARAFASIASIIRRFRPHVIHTHLSKAGLLGRTAGMLTSPAARVHTFHGTLFGGYFGDRSSGAIVRAERFLGHRTGAVIALSQQQRTELLEHRIAPDDRIRIVPLGLDLSRFAGIDRGAARARLGIADGCEVVVAAGRLVPIKRIDRLLRAFASVAGSRPAARLYLVGGGSEQATLERLADELGIGSAVSFAGWTTETPTWFAAADVVALSSDREGTPLALIEAAATGRPVVATAVGGVVDVVEHGVTGLLVPPDDEAALAEALGDLLGDPDRMERMGRAAPSRAARYHAERLVTDLDALYRSLLGDRVAG